MTDTNKIRENQTEALYENGLADPDFDFEKVYADLIRLGYSGFIFFRARAGKFLTMTPDSLN